MLLIMVGEVYPQDQKFLWNQSKNVDLMYLTIRRLYPPNIPHMRPIAFVWLIWSCFMMFFVIFGLVGPTFSDAMDS
jgi:hypothetical protein